MKHQHRVFLLLWISTLCSIIICRKNLLYTLLLDIFVFGLYLIIKSTFDALPNNQKDVEDEIKDYKNEIEDIKKYLDETSTVHSIYNVNNTTTVID